MRASNGSGDSGYSNVAEATTSATSTGVPAAPSSLSGTPVSTEQINLVWADNSGNETGFKLYRSTDAVNFSRIDTLGPNVTTYSDTGRAAGTTYHYRVLLQRRGQLPKSNTVSVTTSSRPREAEPPRTSSPRPSSSQSGGRGRTTPTKGEFRLYARTKST